MATPMFALGENQKTPSYNNYLVTILIYALTADKLERLRTDRKQVAKTLADLQGTTIEVLWVNERPERVPQDICERAGSGDEGVGKGGREGEDQRQGQHKTEGHQERRRRRVLPVRCECCVVCGWNGGVLLQIPVRRCTCVAFCRTHAAECIVTPKSG